MMESMHLFDAVVLGIVEGLTEFLPISSTGHLILADELLKLPDGAFLKSFEIMIQLGAIAAAALMYWRSFFDMEMMKKLIVGFIPTGIIGFLFYKTVKTYLLGNGSVVLAMLALGGFILIAFELWHEEKPNAVVRVADISYKQALSIGFFQSIAIIPGVSRSAATILGGLSLGISRAAIVEFSFLLAVPTMAAATGYDLLKNHASFSADDAGMLAVGFITAFAVALVVMRLFLRYVRTRTFIPFGIYRILAALAFWLIIVR